MNAFSLSRRLLHAFAVFVAIYTFLVLASGGLVTSHGVGMAVPDWPTTFGYNMFLFPVSRWIGGVFYEHSHRLLASWIGIFSLALGIWLWCAEPRRWVKILGSVAFAAVCLQGLLGGLRVLLVNADFGIFHGLLAQGILVALSILAVVTSRAFVSGQWAPAGSGPAGKWIALALALTVFAQLGLAATMRHAHAGLSIPDFPLAYGHWLPDTSPAALTAINARRAAADQPLTTAGLIWLQMGHRFVAVAILTLTLALAWRCRRSIAGVRRMTFLLLGMVAVQITLGICTIWYDKPADVATAHMALGALTLVVSALLAFRFLAMEREAREESLEFSAPPRYSRLSAGNADSKVAA